MEKMLGVMLDCSRNGVLNVDSVKRFADIISKMGYNTIMLYTEDTYEVDNQPFFGHLRGRYSKAELKEMDAYCKSVGIELIPCIQTLAHLSTVFKWADEYEDIKDCDDILLAGEEKTYKLIDDMLSTLSECFSTRKIHIGMDEAYRVGTGKYQKLHGIEDRFDIINNHLHRVCEIADKYGFEPMVWSDMFCKLALNLESQYDEVSDASALCEKANLPENVSLVYWDYYSEDYDHYVSQIKTNKLFGRKVIFAGGAWTWRGFAPTNKFSIKSTDVALRACKEYGIDDVFFTMWGDDGNECSPFAVLPSLMFAAEASRGNTDMESIKTKCREITGCDFDSFMLLDKMDEPGGKHIAEQFYNHCPSKYMLYNDPFMGIRDYMCSAQDCEFYKNLAEEIRNASGKGEFAYLFEAYEKLAEALAVKADLGVRTRRAYLDKNTEELKNVICSYDTSITKIKEFHKAHQARWFTDNKPHGFDVQDIRIGGLLQRLSSCKARLKQLVCGEIDTIPELEEPVLEQKNGSNYWYRIATANIVGHCLD